MEVSEFDEFVSRQQVGEAGKNQINWNQARDEWLDSLNSLYLRIETMLSQYTSTGKIQIAYKPIELSEEDIGAYTARQMTLRIGRQQVYLIPAGTLFIGFKGVVAVVGSAGKASLVLANKDRHSTLPQVTVRLLHVGPKTRKLIERRNEGQSETELVPSSADIEWVWKIMARPPQRQLFELTAENFFQLLMEVSNG
jgi:hypothetical protein